MKLSNYPLLLITLLYINCETPEAPSFEDGKWIDLSYAYESSTPYWPTADGFELDTVFAGMTDGGYYYSAYQFSSAEHGGTHIDAPIHFAQGKKTVDQLTIDQLTGPGIVINVQDSVSDYIDYRISTDDFLQWEAQNGTIPDGSIVFLHTGFGDFWPDRMKYMGTDKRGPEAVALLHFPGLHPDAAQWLVDNRNIKAIGIDTPSIDYGRSSGFNAHRILMEQNIPAFENVANLKQVPVTGAYIIALPMKIKGGSGGPLRITAFVTEK
ncbi:MAG: cyclase family protein [Saprospiraceae bacterium]|nr:cyclase family protein [Saprospiraceae bacterium]